LVAAEIARIEGRELHAERLYEEAIHLAGEHGFVQNEAIAHEVAARCYTGRSLKTIAKQPMENIVAKKRVRQENVDSVYLFVKSSAT
jgi:hypothetical protein